MKTCTRLGLPPFSDEKYLRKVRELALELCSDGCSGPTLQIYVNVCYEHDIHYRLHETIFGNPINRAQSDAVFRERTQEISIIGFASPMAWWRWIALRTFGEKSWRHENKGTPLGEHPRLYCWPCQPP